MFELADEIPDFEHTLKLFLNKVPVEELNRERKLATAMKFFEEEDATRAPLVYYAIESSGVVGLSEEELVVSFGSLSSALLFFSAYFFCVEFIFIYFSTFK